MLTNLIPQNHLTRCVNQVGTQSIEAIGDCLNKLEQKASLDRVSAEVNVARSPSDNVIVQIGREDLDAVTYETALKDRFVGHGKKTLMQMPARIDLENKDYKYEDENSKICFFEESQPADNKGNRVCYVNSYKILQRLAAYQEMADAFSSLVGKCQQDEKLTQSPAKCPVSSMPTVTQQIKLKPGDDSVVLRYYSPLDVTQTITPFDATWDDGTKAVVTPLFNYNNNYDELGQFQGGYDQHAQYFEIDNVKAEGTLTLSGKFAEAAYLKVVVYSHYAVTNEIKDSDLSVNQWEKNPYVPDHKSILFYTDDQYKDTPITPLHYDTAPQFDKKISLYRSDKWTSTQAEEDIAPDGCSRAYLATNRGAATPNYMLLKMKMPTTFFRYNTRDTTFGHYQVQEFSISSTLNNKNDDNPHLDFWSVNSYMLSKLNNTDGNIYVLFLPRDRVKQIVDIEKLPPRTPPMVTLGTGENAFNSYVLSKPTHSIILRYRGPDDNWIGSPVHTSCYPTPQENKPIQDGILGEYTPVITGSDEYPGVDDLAKTD